MLLFCPSKKGSCICPVMVHVQIFSNCLFLLKRKKKAATCVVQDGTRAIKYLRNNPTACPGLVRSRWPEHYGLNPHWLVVEEVNVKVYDPVQNLFHLFSFLIFDVFAFFFVLKTENRHCKKFQRHQRSALEKRINEKDFELGRTP